MNIEKKIKRLVMTFSLLIATVLLVLILSAYLTIYNFGKQKRSPIDEVVPAIKETETIIIPEEELNILSDEKIVELESYKTNLNNFLKQYKASVIYYDLKYEYVYKYNENITYNSASLVKILDTLYLYEKNRLNEFDLYSTMIYESKFQKSSSYGMKRENIGSEINFLTLIDYAMSLSDNTAHAMLVNYIGVNILNSYAKSLGMKYSVSATGETMTLDANDALVMLQNLNKLFLDHDFGEHLKSQMINNHHNYFFWGDHDNSKNVCKYGHISGYYHNIGIIYEDDNPYLIVILTRHDTNYQSVISGISQEIYKFHKLVHEN